ncbi:hypothetical protein OV090_04550 [Nannocystis sp. RBIL2]|uniref:hypothetical protein n=1 Tax=Nannocystis sp. RBIL2 TaxID=2996788 RepID=UPI00226D9E2B|nr:hypothetical protein [Nannocystis sp. RBIL2]MCY1064019.1 hypothetical protein [Nannocystis sp. RBIL2]
MAPVRSLRLKFACDEDWHAFAGDAKVRRCETCRTQVHDLSTLTRSEATALFRSPPASGLCVRYQHDKMGRILFRSRRDPECWCGSASCRRRSRPLRPRTQARTSVRPIEAHGGRGGGL